MKSPARSGWWQNQPSRCGRSAVKLAVYETRASQLVTALSVSVANSPEAGPAGKLGVGAQIGWSGAGRWIADAGPGKTSRANPRHGSIAGLPERQTLRAHQA